MLKRYKVNTLALITKTINQEVYADTKEEAIRIAQVIISNTDRRTYTMLDSDATVCNNG